MLPLQVLQIPAPKFVCPSPAPSSIPTWGKTLAGAFVPYAGSRPSVVGSFLSRDGGLYLSSSRLAGTRTSLITVGLIVYRSETWAVRLSVFPTSYAVASLGNRGSAGT